MKVQYGTPLPCPNCKSTNIHCKHSFGGRCYCADCGVHAEGVSGSNWQQEEYDAVNVWNKAVKAFNDKPYEIPKPNI